jgi:hypothetical protein
MTDSKEAVVGASVCICYYRSHQPTRWSLEPGVGRLTVGLIFCVSFNRKFFNFYLASEIH